MAVRQDMEVDLAALPASSANWLRVFWVEAANRTASRVLDKHTAPVVVVMDKVEEVWVD